MSEDEASTGTTGGLEDANVGVPGAPIDAAATATSQFRPKQPKMGGLKMTGPDTMTPWTGGKPKADRTGLEDDTPDSIQPTQYRPTSITSQTREPSIEQWALRPN